MTLSNAMQNPAQLMAIARTLQDVDLSKIVFVQYPTGYTDDRSGVVPSESANVLNAAGITAVNLGTGYTGPHSLDEQVAVVDLVRITELVRALITAP